LRSESSASHLGFTQLPFSCRCVNLGLIGQSLCSQPLSALKLSDKTCLKKKKMAKGVFALSIFAAIIGFTGQHDKVQSVAFYSDRFRFMKFPDNFVLI